jgi:hypothetical protein
MSDDHRSFYTRDRDRSSRVHTDLTEVSRERLARITYIDNTVVGEALKKSVSEADSTEVEAAIGDTELQTSRQQNLHHSPVMNGDTRHVLSYIEHVITYIATERPRTTSQVDYSDDRIRSIHQSNQ